MERKNIRRIIRFRLLYRLMKGSRRIVLPGFEGLSLYVVSKFFFKSVREGSVSMRASSLAFTFFLALFPTVIFLFTLIPYMPIHDFQHQLLKLIHDIMPRSAYEATQDTIDDIVNKPRGGLLSFGFITALYLSTNGFNAMINAFNETYHEIEPRKPLQRRLVSFYMLFSTIVLLAVAITILVGSRYLFHRNHSMFYPVVVLKWFVLAMLCYSVISVNYFLGPKRKKGWKFFSAGSMFSTVLIIVATLGFAYYVNNFGKYNKLYGSIGTLIVVMMLIYINSLILLLGFDLNASIHSAKKYRKLYDRLTGDDN